MFAERVAREAALAPPLARDPARARWTLAPLVDRGAAQVAANAIRDLMWAHGGIVRSAAGLEQCLAALADIESRLPAGATEEANMVQTARLIAPLGAAARGIARRALPHRLPAPAEGVAGPAHPVGADAAPFLLPHNRVDSMFMGTAVKNSASRG